MKRVVIVGGGFAGISVAKALQGKFHLTLIDNKDYFEFTPSILRTIVDIDHMSKIQVKHKFHLNKVNLINGVISSFDDKQVFIKNKKIKYDYLVLCSGSTYSLPIKEQGIVIATRAEHLANYHNKLKKAENVLIVGGGLVGVELAAEIKDKYPSKEVTILQSSSSLIPRNSDKAKKYVTDYLLSKGTKIIYNERLVGKNGKLYRTESGNIFKSDLAFMCTGISPNTDYFKGKYRKYLDPRGYVKVNNNLFIPEMNNVFVAGDISYFAEEKTAQNAGRQAEVVVKNILAKENGKNMVEYKSKKTPLVISLGKNRGVFESDFITLTGIIPALMKWFIERKEMWKF